MAFEPVLTKNVGRAEARTVAGYRATGGYQALTKALNDGAQLEEILAGAQRYAKEVDQLSTAAQFVKHPATWLNKGCWLDEPESVTAVRNNGGPRRLTRPSGPGGLVEL